MTYYKYQECEPDDTSRSTKSAKKIVMNFMLECNEEEKSCFSEMPIDKVSNYLEMFFRSLRTKEGNYNYINTFFFSCRINIQIWTTLTLR